MAEVIANYPQRARARQRRADPRRRGTPGTSSPKQPEAVPAGNGSGYLNEVSPLTIRTSGDNREH